MTAPQNDIIEATRRWVETFVIGLNLCPFAKRELVRDRIRIAVTEADSAMELLPVLKVELERMQSDDSIGTTLLVHPEALKDFNAYLDFLGVANELLVDLNLEGDIQIASFHPDYQFEGTSVDDASNYTNRSPYPMLHLIREDDISWAVENHPDVDGIPARNIALMEEMGIEKIREMIRID